MRPSRRILAAGHEATALERRHHARGGRPADPHRRREVARLHLTPHPQHPEAHERRPRETVGGQDLRLHVAADRGGGAEHVRDRPHRPEVERQVAELRRRSSARRASRAPSGRRASRPRLTRRSPRGRCARPARAPRRGARARPPRWSGSSRSTAAARPRRRSAPTRGRHGRRPGSPSRAPGCARSGRRSRGGTWRIGTIDRRGGASITSKSSVSCAWRYRSSASARFRAIAARNCAAPWARNASHSFSARNGREYSSVMSTACSSCCWCGRYPCSCANAPASASASFASTTPQAFGR